MKRTSLALSILCLGVLAAGVAGRRSVGNVTSEMVAAGQKFLAGLRKEQQSQAVIPFDDKERLNWHYIPRERKGLPYKSMTSQQRELANSLMASGLSQEGLQKAQGIQRLEDVLRAESGSPTRDPGLYYVSIFGTPGEKRDWGWRMEGHHLSLNFTLRGGQVVSTTPVFLGANPATVHEGPQKGTRVLAKEEELGRALLHTFSGSLRDKVMINVSAPADIVTGASQKAQVGAPVGVSMHEMSPAQGKMLTELVEVYAHRLRKELAEEELAKLQAAGMEKIHFAWAGGSEPGQPHYYRIQGPTFVVEYDNTQDNANHIHTVWRDFDHDFGLDPLRAHYLTSPHHRHVQAAH
jgi:Protein of unknown function (DUF3500)